MDLIDVMGEATRDESTAIAQRLAAVGVLYRGGAGAAECKWWSVDATDAVAAEFSAVQNSARPARWARSTMRARCVGGCRAVARCSPQG